MPCRNAHPDTAMSATPANVAARHRHRSFVRRANARSSDCRSSSTSFARLVKSTANTFGAAQYAHVTSCRCSASGKGALQPRHRGG